MLPYTPLHHLLFAPPADRRARPRPSPPAPLLVMTSGNLSDEPIVKDNEESAHQTGRVGRGLPAPRPGHPRPLRRFGGASLPRARTAAAPLPRLRTVPREIAL
ncbi:MAG: Sua5/YciO/YrdC/YwlC family protein [Caldilineaceae bacterium]